MTLCIDTMFDSKQNADCFLLGFCMWYDTSSCSYIVNLSVRSTQYIIPVRYPYPLSPFITSTFDNIRNVFGILSCHTSHAVSATTIIHFECADLVVWILGWLPLTSSLVGFRWHTLEPDNNLLPWWSRKDWPVRLTSYTLNALAGYPGIRTTHNRGTPIYVAQYFIILCS